MVKNSYAFAFAFALFTFTPLLVFANEGVSCGTTPLPLLTVADFNGDGIVNGQDINKAAKNISYKKPYYALYDRDANGILDYEDLVTSKTEINSDSTLLDQDLAKMYKRFKKFQNIRGYEKLTELGYQAIPVALKGHGVHWFNADGMKSLMGQKQPNPMIAEGLNVSTDEKRVHALFWASAANPVFDNDATDYPHGENWKDGRVTEFIGGMPKNITASANEMWHKHGGLCMPLNKVIVDGEETIVGEAHQFTTYNECQEIPSNYSMLEDETTIWANFWMVHVWLYDLNPNGLFAGTHPCVEKDAPSDSDINGTRDVPPFFAHHM